MTIELVRPQIGLLPGYVAALRTGWSPSNSRDLSGPHLAAIEADAAGFLARYAAAGAAPLVSQLFWISDGSFCGFMSLRYQPGTPELPAHVTGHVGYGVVPWKRGRGVATAALRAVLPLAAAAGLARVLITARPDNLISHRVIMRAGGVAAGLAVYEEAGPQAVFWVPTGPSGLPRQR